MNVKLKPNNELVILELEEALLEISSGGIVAPDEAKKNAMKLQNRGTIYSVGNSCTFVKPGDFVSFYRNASTPITEDGKEYHVVHEAHILAIITQ